jgi:hypothetical protein
MPIAGIQMLTASTPGACIERLMRGVLPVVPCLAAAFAYAVIPIMALVATLTTPSAYAAIPNVSYRSASVLFGASFLNARQDVSENKSIVIFYLIYHSCPSKADF